MPLFLIFEPPLTSHNSALDSTRKTSISYQLLDNWLELFKSDIDFPATTIVSQQISFSSFPRRMTSKAPANLSSEHASEREKDLKANFPI